MELVWLVYAISLLDPLIFALGFAAATLCLWLIATLISYADNSSKKDVAAQLLARSRRILVYFILVVSVLLLIPAKKTAYIMVGAYVTQQIAQNANVQEFGSKVYKLISTQIDTYLEEELEKQVKKVTK